MEYIQPALMVILMIGLLIGRDAAQELVIYGVLLVGLAAIAAAFVAALWWLTGGYQVGVAIVIVTAMVLWEWYDLYS